MKGIALSIGASLFGVFLISTAFLAQEKEEYATTTNDAAALLGSTEHLREYQPTKDSDGDGISDWRETLRNTSSGANNTPRQVYKNPNEIIADLTTGTTSADVSGAAAPGTFTDNFARSYMEKLIRSKHSDSPLELSKEELIVEAVTSIQDAIEHKTYSPSQLTIIRDPSHSDLRSYGNEVGAVLATNVAPQDMDPYALAMEALERNDPKLLRELSRYIDAFAYLRDNTSALAVPANIVRQHLALVNTFSAIHDDFVIIQNNLFTDPLLAFGHITASVENFGDIAPAVAVIRDVLEKHEIYYTREEPGAIIFDF